MAKPFTTIINPKFESERDFVESLPERFDTGELVYSGRNVIRKFVVDGRVVIVKRFGHLNFIKKIIYTFFRPNKAYRSYVNSMEVIHRNVSTPEPLAYLATKKGNLLDELFYASAETKAMDIKSALIDKEPYDEKLMEAYAKFVASLHEKGIYHRDLNPTNVLYEIDGNGGYKFTIIDVNRMSFYDGPVPKVDCMENLTQFWWLTPIYIAVLKVYAKERGWSQADIDEAIHIKEVHDRRWIRRKKFTAHFKRK